MTNQEAINQIRENIALISDLDCTEYEMAISALEKQIPKKTIRVSVGQNGSSTDGCPICKTEFYEKHNFCPTCGNKMDWSD